MNPVYTQLWVDSSFTQTGVEKYKNKFFNRFEKNIKHRMQVEFLEQFYQPKTKWLDFPAGAGRFFDDLSHSGGYAADISDEFLAYNAARGRQIIKADICDFNLGEKFDLITCTHTLNFFKNYKEIIKTFSEHLSVGGTLVFDIQNKTHMSHIKQLGIQTPAEHEGMEEAEIRQLAQRLDLEVAEIRPHDFYDNWVAWSLFEKYKFSRSFYYFYRLINTLYFKFKLYPLFKLYRSKKKYLYAKYLVALRRK